MKFHVVSGGFEEILNTLRSTKSVQATIHECAKGAKCPLATHFSLRIQKGKKRRVVGLILVAIIVLCALFWFGPWWDVHGLIEESGLLFVPRVERGVRASELVFARLEEAKDLTGDDFRRKILAAQRLLTIIESNLGASDKPYKTLRRLQETEEALRASDAAAEGIGVRDEEEELLIKHARLRIEILLQEVELEKQKNKAQLG